jgi:serine phosphatase RsbU (regulator of sigma subunit)
MGDIGLYLRLDEERTHWCRLHALHDLRLVFRRGSGALAGLGYVTARRIFANEQRLAALARELETARRIQTSILPRGVPGVGGLRLAARYQPMAAVAGDLWDFLAVDRRVGLLVADVSGHGVPAALVASMVKVAFEAQRGRGHVAAEGPVSRASRAGR